VPCILAEIGMTILGIVTLVRGRITVVRSKELRGIPAYLVGVLLVGTYPLIFMTAFTAGIVAVLTGNDLQAAKSAGAACEFGSVAFILLASVVLALIWGHDSNGATPLPPWTAPVNQSPIPPSLPMDPNNPYAPPPDTGPTYPYQK
jgi:hypothetical protein